MIFSLMWFAKLCTRFYRIRSYWKFRSYYGCRKNVPFMDVKKRKSSPNFLFKTYFWFSLRSYKLLGFFSSFHPTFGLIDLKKITLVTIVFKFLFILKSLRDFENIYHWGLLWSNSLMPSTGSVLSEWTSCEQLNCQILIHSVLMFGNQTKLGNAHWAI